ncbi:MAG: glycoside hydrolase family 3 C-terminal domain-containing protein, partial [Acidimicrobiales bacterium]|nr:glycoside hydrolase family 3 C-terminal domain-containing protein [Acidimicrobiales bacterium]
MPETPASPPPAEIVAQLDRATKVRLLSGAATFDTEGLPAFGLEPVGLADGPHGLRRQASGGDHLGLRGSQPATCFPTASALGSSWDVDLLHEVGVALGEEALAQGVAVVLGPGFNIKRHPAGGRSFEYLSEDPLLSGKLAAAMVRGVQSQGVGTSVKHFAVNNQESHRLVVDAVVDERTLREVYLTAFEIAVRESSPWTVMCSYNLVNGVYASEHHDLLTTILRDEWGFDGLVVSDYMAINQLRDYHKLARDKADAARMALEAGMDVELPSIDAYGQDLIDAVKAGAIDEALIDRSVRRVLAMKFAFGLFERPYVDPQAVAAVFDTPDQRALAREIAQKSMVLLKNDGDLLPLPKRLSSIAVIGPNADSTRNLLGDYSYPAHIETLITLRGLGFSEHPLPESIKLVEDYADMISVLAAIRQAVAPETEVRYAQGCAVNSADTDGFAAAVDAAQQADVAIVVVGDKAG